MEKLPIFVKKPASLIAVLKFGRISKFHPAAVLKSAFSNFLCLP